MENERFTKIMFLLDRVQNNSSNWNSQVKNTLESLDMESTYTNFTSCSLHYTCRGKVMYMYVLIFKPNCSTIFRCACTKTSDTYIVYILFLIQLHIHTRKIRHARSLKTHQIKIDSLDVVYFPSLRVETSCHRGEAVKDRIRNLCEFRSNEIETEKQFLSHCLFSNKQWCRLIHKIGYNFVIYVKILLIKVLCSSV